MDDKMKPSTGSLVLQSTMCPPAIRMVVIEAYVWEDERCGERSWVCSFGILPVVAIMSKVVASYRHDRPGRYLHAATHEQATEMGWRLDWDERTIEPVVFASYEGSPPDAHEASIREAANSVLHQALCPWPSSEDRQQLKPSAREALSRLRSKFELAAASVPPEAISAIDRKLVEIEAGGVPV